MIEFKNVYYSYEENPALSDINLSIDKGEAIALIGPNGSGKSTLLKLINGLIFPVKGSYIFDGKDINSKSMEDSLYAKLFHKRIGFVFQNSEVQLFCTDVYEEIAFGPVQMGLSDTQIKQRVDDCLELLKITNLEHRQPYHLSGGEKRKVAIASVLALNPEVLVLDEPMNGLDPKTKAFIRELIITLNKSGKTIICSTHDFEYVKGVFNRAIVFSQDHKIIRDGDYDDIISDEEFLRKNNII